MPVPLISHRASHLASTVIVIAIIYANTVYMALLALAGPENRPQADLQLDSAVEPC